MIISIITAMDKNRVIGKDNALPWKLPSELQYVKAVTMGAPIVMGRKNYESIGRPLPGRRNIILTRDKNYKVDGCEIAHSKAQVLKMCAEEVEVFIFGGQEIYQLFLPIVDKLYITKINHEFEGDTFFPEVNMGEYIEISKKDGVTDERNPYEHCFYVYFKHDDFKFSQ